MNMLPSLVCQLFSRTLIIHGVVSFEVGTAAFASAFEYEADKNGGFENARSTWKVVFATKIEMN